MSNSLQPHGLYSAWNSPGQNTGVGSLSLLQGIFPTQGSDPGLPHCRQILYQLSYQGITQPLKKKNRIIPSAVTWMDLETVIPGEVSLTEKDKYHINCM